MCVVVVRQGGGVSYMIISALVVVCLCQGLRFCLRFRRSKYENGEVFRKKLKNDNA